MSATLYDLIPRDGGAAMMCCWGGSSNTRRAGAATLSRPGNGHPGVVRGEKCHPEHTHRIGQIARRGRGAIQGPGARQTVGLYLPDQGTGQREMARALPRVRPGQCGPEHGRRLGQPRRPGAVLHGGNPGQYRLARGRAGRGSGSHHGRIPLLRRPGARGGVADSIVDDAPGAVFVDVGHAGRDGVFSRKR